MTGGTKTNHSETPAYNPSMRPTNQLSVPQKLALNIT